MEMKSEVEGILFVYDDWYFEMKQSDKVLRLLWFLLFVGWLIPSSDLLGHTYMQHRLF
jgi:hypothetical protein